MKTNTLPIRPLIAAAFGLAVLTSILALRAEVGEPPTLLTPPQSQTALVGATAIFSVVATGTPPLAYQWRSYANPTQYTNVPWGLEATLSLTNVQQTSRRFGVVVSNAFGMVTSSPLAALTVVVPATVTRQPVATLTAEAGNVATLGVTVGGTPPLAVQWHLNDAPLTNRTNTTLALTNLQFGDAGSYSVVATNLFGAATSQVARLTVIPPIFTKVTNSSVIALPVASSGGSAWGDYDDDGDEDLWVGTRNFERDFLYRNNGDGTFTMATNTPLTADALQSSHGVWGDYDNDGDLDLFVGGGAYTTTLYRSFLFRNEGGGQFTRVTTGPVATDQLDGVGGGWTDYDNDGFLDLFLVSNADTTTNVLYHNSGDGAFTRTTTILGTPPANPVHAVWGDYDNDGRQDLAIIGGINYLYRNVGQGQFERITHRGIATTSNEGIAGKWGDYDNDGFLDLYLTEGGTADPRGLDRLFHNDRAGGFDLTADTGIDTQLGYGTGCSWGDFDADGFLDLFVCRQQNTDNILYRNEGNGTFSRITRGSLGTIGGNSPTCAWADYDNDGFLDLWVSNGGFVGAQSSFLYRNNGHSNAWLKLKLAGTASNRSAMGAKIRLRAVIGGASRWQLREISSEGFGMNSLIAYFGLGDATSADLVRIEWPSGTVQELRNVAAKQSLTLTEPPRLQAAVADGQLQLALTAWPGQRFALESSTNLIDWTPFTTVTNTSRTATLADTPDSPQRFYRATP
jgi:hypothetical protein